MYRQELQAWHVALVYHHFLNARTLKEDLKCGPIMVKSWLLVHLEQRNTACSWSQLLTFVLIIRYSMMTDFSQACFLFRRRWLLQNENIKCDDKRQYFQAVLPDECSCDRWLLLSGCQWLHLFSTLSFIPWHAPSTEVIAYILVSWCNKSLLFTVTPV